MKAQQLSVSQVNHFVKSVLANNPLLKRLTVTGEISNFKWHSSGHLYFSLKDATGRLSCVMFRSDAQKLTFMPQDGMHVVATGRIDVYERAGAYQLYVHQMKPAGVGDLYLAYEALKKDLAQKGYFDPGFKKPLPDEIRKVGVVTAATGAAIHDIISVIRRRDPGVAIVLSPAQVQGKGAAASIVKALHRLETRDDVDVIIIGRGGGSMEDLWAFNERPVADAIFESEKVIVSAVGHETDFLISDEVADLRAPTPSAAAEMVTDDRTALYETLARFAAMLARQMTDVLSERRATLNQLRENLLFYSPRRLLSQQKEQLDLYTGLLKRAIHEQLRTKRSTLTMREEQLLALNPKRILSRGYAMVYRDGKVVTSARDVQAADELCIVFGDGEAIVKVIGGERVNGDEEV